mmetsp:Transcript_16149/g.39788  ORF Transcript_16149/g.39788 Transcript_16149/m.39788 type:complete len:287 (-) Transcript_16149:762-1622(-)
MFAVKTATRRITTSISSQGDNATRGVESVIEISSGPSLFSFHTRVISSTAAPYAQSTSKCWYSARNVISLRSVGNPKPSVKSEMSKLPSKHRPIMRPGGVYGSFPSSFSFSCSQGTVQSCSAWCCNSASVGDGNCIVSGYATFKKCERWNSSESPTKGVREEATTAPASASGSTSTATATPSLSPPPPPSLRSSNCPLTSSFARRHISPRRASPRSMACMRARTSLAQPWKSPSPLRTTPRTVSDAPRNAHGLPTVVWPPSAAPSASPAFRAASKCAAPYPGRLTT